uniref:Basic leucine zipper transcriptional factor ATF-like n=1 Tax=Sus scrofa TaxID=9823 RepID=A0ABB5UR15_PIG
MPHSSDSSDSSFSRSPPPSKQDSSDDVRKVQRREKNRIAAQKSRQRQTQKADTLHLVSAQTSLPPPELQALFPPPVNAWTIALSLPVWGCICGAVNGGVRATGE